MQDHDSSHEDAPEGAPRPPQQEGTRSSGQGADSAFARMKQLDEHRWRARPAESEDGGGKAED
ncbi:MAG TPA: hypothetical protein VEA40_05800 [Ramlibacter sp.]|nr:hypothetical protein [Ramlibacter sp.]